MLTTIRKAARLWQWWVVTAILLLVLAKISPQNLEVLPYKLINLTIAAIAGYWLDKGLFVGMSPDDFKEPLLKAAAMLRRALFIGLALLAMAQAL